MELRGPGGWGLGLRGEGRIGVGGGQGDESGGHVGRQRSRRRCGGHRCRATRQRSGDDKVSGVMGRRTGELYGPLVDNVIDKR